MHFSFMCAASLALALHFPKCGHYNICYFFCLVLLCDMRVTPFLFLTWLFHDLFVQDRVWNVSRDQNGLLFGLIDAFHFFFQIVCSILYIPLYKIEVGKVKYITNSRNAGMHRIILEYYYETMILILWSLVYLFVIKILTIHFYLHKLD